MLIKIFFVSMFLFASFLLFGQTNEFYLRIEEKSYLAPVSYCYIIKNNQLRITKFNFNDANNQKLIYKEKLDDAEIDQIHEVINTINIFKLDTIYSKQALDGFLWCVEVQSKTNRIKIVVENTIQPDVNVLFQELNNLIKKRKYHISLTF